MAITELGLLSMASARIQNASPNVLVYAHLYTYDLCKTEEFYCFGV